MTTQAYHELLEAYDDESRDRIKDAVIRLNLRTDDPVFPLLLILDEYLQKMQELSDAEESHVNAVNQQIQAAAEQIGLALDDQKTKIENLVTDSVEKQLKAVQNRLLKASFHRIEEELQSTESRLRNSFSGYEDTVQRKLVQDKKRTFQAVESELEKLVLAAKKNAVHPVARLISSLAFWGTIAVGLTAFAMFFISIGGDLAHQGITIQQLIGRP